MHTQTSSWRRPLRRYLQPSLALLLILLLGWGVAQPVQAALYWRVATLESTGMVGQYTSLALSSSSTPVISYYDATNGDLKLLRCGDLTCTSDNTTQVLDSVGDVGRHTSLVLDSSGNPVISYYDATNRDLKLILCSNAGCTSSNVKTVVDSAGSVGEWTSLRLDSSGKPVISYYDGGNGDLKLVHCGNATCTTGNTIVTVDSTGAAGYGTSMKLDSSGNPIIAYYELTNGDLRLARCGNPTCSSGNTLQTVDSTGNVETGVDMELNSSGNPVIAYYDTTNRDLKLALCGSSSCTGSNIIVTVQSTGGVGVAPSLVLASGDLPIISYLDDSGGFFNLRLIRCGNFACISGNTTAMIDAARDAGLYPSLLLDSSGNPVMSYYDGSLFDFKFARQLNDPSAPTADPLPSTTANANGWYRTDVSVTWRWFDAGGSGLDTANCTASSASSGEGVQTLSATCKDLAGNTGSATYQVKVDKTAPTANPTQSPSPAPSGWNNTNVTVNWNWSDNAGGSNIDPANCTTSSVSSGSGTITFTATCKDLAGNEKTATYQVQVDPTAPTANPSQSPAANAAGWNNSDVTVNWNWTFTGAIIDTANCTTTSTSSGEGTLTLSATCKDVALNQRTVTYPVKVDKTAPVVTITGVSAGATYALGSVPVTACNATDAHSGVAAQATLAVTGGNPNGTGTFTATCSGATDNADNSASAVSVGYTVVAVATSTPTETATETSQPTATPSATDTPSPTSTAIATSTPTPGATNTPLPTPIMTPGLASITIALDVRPNAVTNYSFNGSFGAFRLDDSGADDGDNFTNSRTFLVTAGSYSVSRAPTNNRVTSAIDCTLANRAVVNLDANLVTLTVAGGDNLTCTFVVERSSSIDVRVFADLVRNKANLGKRNAGDPWLQGWSVTLFSSPTTLIATRVTTPTATAGLYEATFADLRPGTYVVCSALPTGAWIFTTPTVVDPLYGLPCKSITLEAAQNGLLLFGAYQATAPATVVAADSAEAVVTDEDQIIDLPYDPAEEESVHEETSTEPANRLFLPLVNR